MLTTLGDPPTIRPVRLVQPTLALSAYSISHYGTLTTLTPSLAGLPFLRIVVWTSAWAVKLSASQPSTFVPKSPVYERSGSHANQIQCHVSLVGCSLLFGARASLLVARPNFVPNIRSQWRNSTSIFSPTKPETMPRHVLRILLAVWSAILSRTGLAIQSMTKLL